MTTTDPRVTNFKAFLKEIRKSTKYAKSTGNLGFCDQCEYIEELQRPYNLCKACLTQLVNEHVDGEILEDQVRGLDNE